MFNNICLKNDKLNIGVLCESLLFYQNVSVLAGRDDLIRLFKRCSIRGVEQLIKEGRLTIYIGEEHLGPAILPIDQKNNINGYILDTYSSKSSTYEKVLFQAFDQITKNVQTSLKLVKEFAPLVKPFTYSQSISSLVKNDFNDANFLRNSLYEYINDQAPGIIHSPFDIEVSIIEENPELATKFFGEPRDLFRFESNLPIDKIQNEQIARTHITRQSDIYSGYLLSLLESIGDVNTAMQLSSEILTRELHSSIIKYKFKELYDKVTKSQFNINEFNDEVLTDYHSVGEAVRLHKLPFSKFLEILHISDRFKSWLKDSPDDPGLLAQYYKATAKDGKFESFPLKHMKFVLSASIGWAIGQYTDPKIAEDLLGASINQTILSTVFGTTFNAIDTFYIDQLLKGWKPNQYVEGKLIPRLPKK